MNSKAITKQRNKLPLWLLVTAILLFMLISLSSLAYKKWVIDPSQQHEKSALILQQQNILKQEDAINTNWLRTLDPLVKNVEGRLV